MPKQNIISSADDMTAHFLNNIVLKSSYNNMIFNYTFKNDFGKGHIERIIINNDIEIWINNIFLFNEEIISYDMPKNTFEISCCTKGDCSNHFDTDSEILEIESGKIFLFAKMNISGRVKYSKNMDFQSISIMTTKEYILSLINKYSKTQNNCWNQLDQEKIDELYLGRKMSEKETILVNEIISCKMNNPTKLIYLNAKAHEFISLKIDEITYENKMSMHTPSNLSNYNMAKMDMARSILIANMSKPPSIDELAKLVGINSTKLKKDFKTAFNTTIYGFLRDKRLELSKQKLYDKELTIAEVANEVGYSNPSKFAKAFRTKYGINPKELRQEHINL